MVRLYECDQRDKPCGMLPYGSTPQSHLVNNRKATSMFNMHCLMIIVQAKFDTCTKLKPFQENSRS